VSEKVEFDKFTDNDNQLLRDGTRFFADDEAYFARYKVDRVVAAVRHLVRRVLEYGCDAVLLKPAELLALLRAVGLQPKSRDYCLFVPPKLNWVAAVERFLSWLPLGGQYWVRAAHPCGS